MDDPRNTDNAWMETVVLHFHDEAGDKVTRHVTRDSRHVTREVAGGQVPAAGG